MLHFLLFIALALQIAIAIGSGDTAAAAGNGNSNSNSNRMKRRALTTSNSSVCACSPSEYEFSFNFTSTCPPVNVTINQAVSGTTCFISAFEQGRNQSNPQDPRWNESMSLVPTEISNIDILELGQHLEVIGTRSLLGPFVHGDQVQFQSIIGQEHENQTMIIPRAIQANIFATNQDGENLVNVFLILFSNDCDAYPSIVAGQSLGWLSIDRIVDPSPAYCDAAAALSIQPSVPPTDIPATSTMSPSSYDNGRDDEQRGISGHPSLRPSLAPVVSSFPHMDMSFSFSMNFQTSAEMERDLEEVWEEFGRSIELEDEDVDADVDEGF